MTDSDCPDLFERILDCPLADAGLRPGGLELTRRAVEVSGLTEGARVLDVGSGTGVTVQALLRDHDLRAVGVDSSMAMVSRGKARDAALPLVVGDARSLPFPDSLFDGAIIECVLSLVKDRVRALRECLRTLKPGGALMATDLYARNPEAIHALRRLSVRSCLKGALVQDEFLRECKETGFELVCFEDRSAALKDFAAQVIWTYGSLECFLSEPGAGCASWAARPGYFLYVGRKSIR